MPNESVEGSDRADEDRSMIGAVRREPGLEVRVLLVDDDALIREVYSRFLRKLGCVVEIAASGAAALEILGTAPFDLIVSDINMAGMSGIQFLRAVREHNMDVPVILMTGAEVETTREAVDYMAFRLLIKPIAFAVLAKTVRAAIHKHVVARILSERVPLLTACRQIVLTTCQGNDWDFAAIWVPSDGDHMHCAETWARPGLDVAAFESATMTLEVEVERGFPRKGWTCDSQDWIPDISSDANVPRLPGAIAAGFQSSFVVPIGAEGEVFAVLEFFGRRHQGPDLALLELFATTGAQLSGQVIRERAERRATLAETASKPVRITPDAILECAPASIVAVDEHGKILFTNKLLPHLKRDDVIGSDWTQDVDPARDDQHRARLRRILTTGVAETYETIVVGAEGRTLSFATHVGPLRDNDRITGAVLVTQDVTELKRTQAELADARQLVAGGTVATGIAGTPCDRTIGGVFLSQSEIAVPPEQGPSLEQAFVARAKLVDRHAGFLGLELLKDLRADSGRYVLLTRWRSRADFVAYMRSGDHGRAHERPHAGLDLGGLHGGKLQQFQVMLSEQVDEPAQS